MGFYVKKEGYKKPDVKAPRFRKERLCVISEDLFRRYKEKYPKSEIDYKTFRKIILTFNRTVSEKIVTHRDGVELPEQLGYIFIGACPKISRTLNVDPTLSAEYNKKLQHKNWGSNQYVCKIFYSNYGTKYRFLHREIWFFTACRKLKRSASKSFLTNWNKYIKVSPISKVSNFFRAQGGKSLKITPYDYKHRRIDISNTQPE